MSVTLNAPVPREIRLAATNGQTLSLADFSGQWVVLYFYPKDATPGCTTESRDFAVARATFQALGAVILGISRDSVPSHERFRTKEGLDFDLLSDPEEQLCAAFGVMKQKNMYGKQVRGIERSTFLIDPEGVVRAEWRNVKVPGHVEEVLDQLRARLPPSP